MDFISSWLKGIVLIILFASFMDLLLPSSSMQKYVKLVVGLIIVIAMLTPLLVILNGQEAFSGNNFLNWEQSDAMIASVMDDVSQQMAFNHQDMVIDTARQMANKAIVQVIQIQGTYQLVDFDMDVKQQTDGQTYEITQLDVYVKPMQEQIGVNDLESNRGAGTTGELTNEEIERITIDSIEITPILPDKDQESEGIGMRSGNQGNRGNQESSDQESQELKSMLAKYMELSEKSIRIYSVEES